MKRNAWIVPLVVSLAVAGLGCDDSESSVDSGPVASDATATDATAPDAGIAVVDAAPTPIDAAAHADAAVGHDATSADVAAVCTAVCERREECVEEGAGETCIAECTGELGDCSAGGLDAVINCTTRPCPGVESCLSAVPCVE